MEQRKLAELLRKTTPSDSDEFHQGLELEYVRTYNALIDQIDRLMVYENRDGDTVTEVTEEKLKDLEDMQTLRKLIMASGMRTLPILRAVHQVEGIPEKERWLASKISDRDELSQELMTLQREVDSKRNRLNELKKANVELLAETKQLSSQVITRSVIQEETDRTIKLKEQLQAAIDKSTKYAEAITSIIVENGLDWYDDDDLREVVELCGEIQHI